MSDLLDVADRLWRGELDLGERHPLDPATLSHELVEITDGVAFVEAFANVVALESGGALGLIDTSSVLSAPSVHQAVRGWNDQPLHTAVYTHGHVDHVFGMGPFEEENADRGAARATVIAHEDVPRRFDRYGRTLGYNAIINQRQFQLPGLGWPSSYRRPDVTYSDRMTAHLDGLRLELRHARGETDDATWVWIPDHRVLCPGDLFIWASPNAGNPQKVQRYAGDWAAALREMAGLEPVAMLPGHGLPVIGAERVTEALTSTAELLEHLEAATLDLMNEGARLNDVIHAVEVPAHLADKPWLQPVYDEPEFVVRNVWRLFGGWWDGNPANLKPASESAVAGEMAALAGGADRLAARARELAVAGDLRLACHLAEMAALAAPDDRTVHEIRGEVYEQRMKLERSTMSRGVFRAAANDSRSAGR